MTSTIADNIARIRSAIDAARRSAQDVKLIAVSKTHPVESIRVAIDAGQYVFGENTTQEALAKIPTFVDAELEWHFIGHLQSNKAKFVPGHFSWLHSLDSVKLAQRLSRAAQEQQALLRVLIEVNVTRDPQKHGVAPTDIFSLIDDLLKQNLPNIELRGLMTVGPHPAGESEIRAAFASLRRLRDDVAQRFALPNFTELSMGMSGDYLDAVKEGSTMIRVGSAIFGARDYA